MNKNDEKALEQALYLSKFIEDGVMFVNGSSQKRPGYLRGRPKAVPITKVVTADDVIRRGAIPSDGLKDALVEFLKGQQDAFQSGAAKRKNAEFYRSRAWLSLRYEVLSDRGGRCECCGATAKDGAKLHVDHIKPRSRFPELALVKSNLQVLCGGCNIGKSDRRSDDWRRDKPSRTLIKAP